MPRRPFDPPFDSAQASSRGSARGGRAQDRPLPPPEQFTAADLLHIGLGLLMVPLGLVILVRTLSIAVTVMGVLVGGAFVAFGVHRLWLAWNRYRLYRQNKRKVPNDDSHYPDF